MYKKIKKIARDFNARKKNLNRIINNYIKKPNESSEIMIMWQVKFKHYFPQDHEWVNISVAIK